VERVLQMLGAFASMTSVPLAVYLYMRTLNNRYEKVRQEIIRIYASHIGAGGVLTSFFITSILHAKLRADKLKDGVITEISLLEDLIADISCNPLLSSQAKGMIFEELLRIKNGYAEEKEVDRLMDEALRNTVKRGKKSLAKKTETANVFITTAVAIACLLIAVTLLFPEVTKHFTNSETILEQVAIGIIISLTVALVLIVAEKIITRFRKNKKEN